MQQDNRIIIKAVINTKFTDIGKIIFIVLLSLAGLLWLFSTIYYNIKSEALWDIFMTTFDEDKYHQNMQALEKSCLTVVYIYILLFCTAISSQILKFFYGKNWLTLMGDRIIGAKATLFSTNEIYLPFKDINSITRQADFRTKIYVGDTLCITTQSGTIKIPCVENAKEFQARAMEILKASKGYTTKSEEIHQESNIPTTNTSTNIINQSDSISSDNQNNDTATRLNKLKSLKDQGLISEEEYQAQRNKILSDI